MTSLSERLSRLGDRLPLLHHIRRGIEKEGLRVDARTGSLALTPHPEALGSTLTHSQITTDYSESLLELIAGTHHSVEALLAELDDIHRFVTLNIPDEVIWNQSMPAALPPPEDIPVGWYGHSNIGMFKHVYRLGLAERYGKPMQCIAGIHYNFSVPDETWDVLGIQGPSLQDKRSNGYLALIRNFMRHSWLLMYLFGASPAVSRQFLAGVDHTLDTLDNDTLYLPWATSLRMSDIGYQNKAQSELQLCYNDLDTFLARIYNAVTTPWPAYEAIGTHRDGKWIQLNTNVLQIENEYYSSIRPKRVAHPGERAATALARRGVEYVEVRCMDVDPFTPVGISADTARFLDTFLLFCTIEDSPCFPDGGFCTESRDNYNTVVRQGRQPGLMLSRDDTPISLHSWATDVVERMAPYAGLLDKAMGGTHYQQALQRQQEKIDDSDKTPSARILGELQSQSVSLHAYTLQQSLAHRADFLARPLDAKTLQAFQDAARNSIDQQKQLEENDTESFDSYMARFHDSLKATASVRT